MNINTIKKSLNRKQEAIFIIIALTTIIGLYINFLLPKRFEAKSKILLVQENASNIDTFTAIRGAEQAANTLKHIVNSPAVLGRILNENPEIKEEYFKENAQKRAKQWKKLTKTTLVPNTGILTISTYHPDPKQAQGLAEGLISTLKKNNQAYFGQKNNLQLTVLEKPSVGTNYAQPNALVNTFLGFLVGLAISGGLVYFYPEKELQFSLKKSKRETSPKLKGPKDLPA